MFSSTSRSLLLAIAFIITPLWSAAQVITTEPAFPTAGESVTVYFDATQGTGGLENFDGTVYAHTGVITDESTDDSDWKYVIADWGVNPDKIALERIEPNLYKLEITPSIREYYGVPEGETIEKMAFVFRNADGSKEAKGEGGDDIFAQVYQSGLSVRFISESSYAFGEDGVKDTLRAVASSDDPDLTLKLFEGETEVASVQNDTLIYEYTGTAGVRADYTLIGTLSAEQADTARYYVITPESATDQDRPSGLEDGITIVDDNTIRLSLYAPYKEFVYVIGDFNNWVPTPEYQMNVDIVDSDNAWYWIEIDGLNPDQQHAFQYFVDGEIRVADPYSRLVLDPGNDAFIPTSTFPNLKPYPSDKTEFAVSLVDTDPEEYIWEVTDFQRPPKDELVVYELLLRDFLETQNFQTLTDTLGYLENLGVNAIELMPVSEFDGNLSWGYNPAFHLALDKYYGTPNAFKKFVDEAHKRGIAVILDVVYNHATGSSPLVRLWNEGDYGHPTSENPYVNPDQNQSTADYDAKHPFNVFYDMNHESEMTKYWLDRANRFWLEEYNVDGYRFDLTKGFTQRNYGGDVGAWSSYDASRVALLKRMVDQVWAYDDSAYMIFEHLGQLTEENELSDYGILLWHKMTEPYNEATMGYHSGGKSNIEGMYFAKRGFNKPHVVGYMESHDEERLMFKNLEFGNSNSDTGYDITELNTALERQEAAGAFAFLIPGPKMLWQFGELGYDYSINYPTNTSASRTGEKPVRWDYLDNPDRKRLYDVWSALINLRMEAPVFHNTDSDLDFYTVGAVKEIYYTLDGVANAERAYLVGNFDVVTQEITPGFLNGKYYEYFTGDSIDVASDEEITMTLVPGEFRVYTSTDYGVAGVENVHVTPIEDEQSYEVPEKTQLLSNYPNPFNPSTTIPFELASSNNVTLTIYNMLGQRVATLIDGQQYSAGTHQVTFDASGLASGVYIMNLRTAAGTNMSSTMTLMK